MKSFITRNSRPCFDILRRVRNTTLVMILVLGFQSVQAQYISVPVTGVNNDIIANGGGANGTPNTGVTYPAIGVDGAQYCLVTQGYTAGSTTPTCFMPTNNQTTSLLTPGLPYNFQN